MPNRPLLRLRTSTPWGNTVWKNRRPGFRFALVVMALATGCAAPALRGNEVRLFAPTPAWALAQAAAADDTVHMAQLLARAPRLVGVREPRFGQTLLLWAVGANHYPAAHALLRHGANPNVHDSYRGLTPLIQAADYYGTSAYVKLLLAYHADPNLAAPDSLESKATPLIAAAYQRLESVRLLVEAGAAVNYEGPYHKSALKAALLSNRAAVVRYLLLEQGADFKRPVGYTVDGVPVRVTDLLREWVFPLDSEEYRTKQEIVAYLQQHGEDYRKAPIPEQYRRHYSKAYLSRY